jgi:hypothetical protein
LFIQHRGGRVFLVLARCSRFSVYSLRPPARAPHLCRLLDFESARCVHDLGRPWRQRWRLSEDVAVCVYREPARFKQSQVRIGAPNETIERLAY